MAKTYPKAHVPLGWKQLLIFLLSAILVFVAGVVLLIYFFATLGEDMAWSNTLHSYRRAYKASYDWQGGVVALQDTVRVSITAMRWERRVHIEKRMAVNYEGWEVPAGARVLDSWQAIESYRKIPNGRVSKTRTVKVVSGTRQYACGKIDKGKGQFEDKICTDTIYTNKTENYQEISYREEPVYRTKYRYLIEEWRPSHINTSNGNDKNPYWEDRGGSEMRVALREEAYFLSFKDPSGRQTEEQVNQKIWAKVNKNQQVALKKEILADFPIDFAENALLPK